MKTKKRVLRITMDVSQVLYDDDLTDKQKAKTIAKLFSSAAKDEILRLFGKFKPGVKILISKT